MADRFFIREEAIKGKGIIKVYAIRDPEQPGMTIERVSTDKDGTETVVKSVYNKKACVAETLHDGIVHYNLIGE